MVCIGLGYVVQGELLTGVIITAGGRICDLLDGIVAERTGTKSPIGGATDASFDKLGALAALLVLGTEQIVPWWAVALIGAQNTANSIIGAIGLHRRLKVRPVQAGKLSTALEWAAFFWFILTADNLTLWHWPAYVLLGAALILGIYATIAYARALSTPAASAASPSRARRT